MSPCGAGVVFSAAKKVRSPVFSIFHPERNINTYTVKLDVDGGKLPDGATSPIKEKYGTSVELPTPTKDHYVFKGWLNGEVLLPLDKEFPVTGNATLKADWEIETYPVNFAIKSLDEFVDYQEIGYGGYVAKPFITPPVGKAAPAKWFSDADMTTEWVFTRDKVTEEITLWGEYVDTVATVAFMDKSGGNVIKSVKVSKGEKIGNNFPTDEQIAALESANPGKKFKSWATLSGAFTKDTVITDDVNVFPVWEDVVLTVTFDANGGKLGDGSATKTVNVTYGDTVAQLGDPEQAGYKFTGWYAVEPVEGYDGSAYEFGTPVTTNLKLNAGWEKVYYVTFKADDAVVATLEVGAGQKVNPSDIPKAPSKNGFTFKNWSFNENAFNFLETAINYDITLDAVYVQSIYNATFQPETLSSVSYNNRSVATFSAPAVSQNTSEVTLSDSSAVPYTVQLADEKNLVLGNYVAFAVNFTQPSGIKMPVGADMPDDVLYTMDTTNGLYHVVFPLRKYEGGEFQMTFTWDNDNSMVYTVDTSKLVPARGVMFVDETLNNDGFVILSVVNGKALGTADGYDAIKDKPTRVGQFFEGWTEFMGDGELVTDDTIISEDTVLVPSFVSALGAVDVAPLVDTNGAVTGDKEGPWNDKLALNYEIGENKGDTVDEDGNVPVTINLDTLLYGKSATVGLTITPPAEIDGIQTATYQIGTGKAVTDKDLKDGLNIPLTAKANGEYTVAVKWLDKSDKALASVDYVVDFSGDMKLVKAPALKDNAYSTGLGSVTSVVDQENGNIVVSLHTADGYDDVAAVVDDGTNYNEGATLIGKKAMNQPADSDSDKVKATYAKVSALTAVAGGIDGKHAFVTLNVGPTRLFTGYEGYLDEDDEDYEEPITFVDKGITYELDVDEVVVTPYYTVRYEGGSYTSGATTGAGKITIPNTDKVNKILSIVEEDTELTLVPASYATNAANSGSTPVTAFKEWSVAIGDDDAEALQPGKKITVTDNTVITAIWGKAVTVEFDTTEFTNTDAANLFKKQTIGEGGVATKPVDPTRDGRTFKYWATQSTDEDGNPVYTEFSFDTPVVEDTTLYAVWDSVAMKVYKTNLIYDANLSVAENEAALAQGYGIYAPGETLGEFTEASADELNEIDVKFDALVKYKPALYTDKISDAGYYVGIAAIAPEKATGYNYAFSNTEADVTAPSNFSALNNNLAPNKKGSGIDAFVDYSNPSSGINFNKPVYLGVQWVFDNSDTSEVYLFKLNFPRPDSFTVVDVDHKLATGESIVDPTSEEVLMNATDTFNSYTILVKKGFVIDNEGPDFVKMKGAVSSSFNGYTVKDVNNDPVEPDENGQYTVDGTAMTVDYNWLANVKVSFDRGSGTGKTMTPAFVKQDEEYPVPECTYENNGAPFIGWQPDAAVTVKDEDGTTRTVGTSDVVKPGETLVIRTADIKLTAKWGTYVNITIDKADGSEVETVKHISGTDYVLPADPAREGYDFVGWMVAGGGTSGLNLWVQTETLADGTVKKSIGGVDIALSLTAQWTPTVTVRGTTNSAGLLAKDADSLRTIKVEQDENDKTKYNITAEELIPYSSGNTMFTAVQDGHYVAVELEIAKDLTATNESAELTGGNKDHSLAVANGNLVTAVFRLDDALSLTTKTFEVSFEVNGARVTRTFDVSALADKLGFNVTLVSNYPAASGLEEVKRDLGLKAKGSTIDLPENTFEALGYRFTGWDTDKTKSYASPTYTDKDDVTVNANTTLYALWDPKYTVVLNADFTDENGQPITKSSKDDGVFYLDGDSYTLPETCFVQRKGYEFKGWAKTSKGTVLTSYTIEDAANRINELFAVWEPVKYSYLADFNGGTWTHGGTSHETHSIASIPYGTKINLNTSDLYGGTTLSRPGYVLTGWDVYVDDEKVETVGTAAADSFDISGNTKVVAQWQTHLGKLNVAELKDASTPAITDDLYLAESYKLVNIEHDDVEDEDVITDITGTTGTATLDGTSTEVNVTITAEDLVRHLNAPLYGSDLTGYWVGLTVAPPEGLDVNAFALDADTNGQYLNSKVKAATKYFSAYNLSQNVDQMIVKWGNKTSSTSFTPVATVTYKVNFVGSFKPASYNVQVRNNGNVNLSASDANWNVGNATDPSWMSVATATVAQYTESAPLTVSTNNGWYLDKAAIEEVLPKDTVATWNDDEKPTSVVLVFKPSGSEQTLTVQLPAAKQFIYHVTYDPDEGSFSVATLSEEITKTYKQKVTLPNISVASRNGYSANNWLVNGVPTGGETDVEITDNTTIKPNWFAKTVKITYQPDCTPTSGAIQGNPRSYTFDTEYKLIDCPWQRTGFTFLGWSKTSQAEEPDYQVGEDVGSVIGSDTTLYAVWHEDDKVTVTYVLGNGHFFTNQADETKSVHIGENFTLLAQISPDNFMHQNNVTDKKLLGWRTATGSTVLTGTYSVTENTTLYAMWGPAGT